MGFWSFEVPVMGSLGVALFSELLVSCGCWLFVGLLSIEFERILLLHRASYFGVLLSSKIEKSQCVSETRA